MEAVEQQLAAVWSEMEEWKERVKTELGKDPGQQNTRLLDHYNNLQHNYNNLLILLQRAAPPGSQHHPVQPTGSYYDLKLPSPSSIGYAEYQKLMGFREDNTQKTNTEPAFLNFRPAFARPPPLQLFHPYLGTFMDIFHGQSSDAAAQPVASDYAFVLVFSRVMSNVYPTEANRQNPGALNAAGFDEIKNEFHSASADPMVQGMAHYFLFWKHRKETFIHKNSCCPALLLEILGASLRISALVFGQRVMCQPLTPFLHIMDMQLHDPHHMETVARAMVAYRITLSLLTSYGQVLRQAEKQPASQPELHRQLAQQVLQGQHIQIGVVPRLLVVAGLPWRLQNPQLDVKRLLDDKQQLYVVRYINSQEELGRIFKYTQRYDRTVHEQLASCDPPLAPRLYSCLLLPGGIYEVQMEFLRREDGWRMLHEVAEQEEARTTAFAMLERVHAMRLVLGDARDANVLVRTTETGPIEVRFIDLDWAGLEGQTHYPPFMNPAVAWPEGASDGKPITQVHDRMLLSSVLQER